MDVSGTSKGHGYTGRVQRWNQHTGPMAHGSKYHRGVGSLSANSDPSRVFKNKQMAGQLRRDEHVTVQNLEVVRVDARAQPDSHQGRSSRRERLPALSSATTVKA